MSAKVAWPLSPLVGVAEMSDTWYMPSGGRGPVTEPLLVVVMWPLRPLVLEVIMWPFRPFPLRPFSVSKPPCRSGLEWGENEIFF